MVLDSYLISFFFASSGNASAANDDAFDIRRCAGERAVVTVHYGGHGAAQLLR